MTKKSWDNFRQIKLKLLFVLSNYLLKSTRRDFFGLEGLLGVSALAPTDDFLFFGRKCPCPVDVDGWLSISSSSSSSPSASSASAACWSYALPALSCSEKYFHSQTLNMGGYFNLF
jgi:hypothetical protein